jgi:hypothetical protein
MVYPALLMLMRTPQLPVVDLTEALADLNGLARFAERRNLVSALASSHFKRSLRYTRTYSACFIIISAEKKIYRCLVSSSDMFTI